MPSLRLGAGPAAVFSITLLSLLQSTHSYAINLPTAIDQALNNVPAIRAEREQVRASEQAVLELQGAEKPQVNFNISAGAQKVNSTTTRPLYGGGYTGFWRDQESLRLTQLLFDNGGTALRIGAAKQDLWAQEYRIDALQDKVALDAAATYIDVLKAKEFVELAEENVKNSESLTGMIQQQVAKGRAPAVDYSLADSRLQNAFTDLQGFKGDLEDAHVRYIQLMGQPPTVLTTVTPIAGLADLTREEALRRTFANNPELRLAKENIGAAHSRASAARESRLPRFDVEAYLTDGTNLEGTEGDNGSYGANLVMSYDLYTGGSNRARERRELANQNAAEFDLDERKRQLTERTYRALNDLKTTTQNLVFLKKQVENNDKILLAYRQQLSLGQRTPLDVLNVQETLYRSILRYRDTANRQLRAQFELLATTGELRPTLQTGALPTGTLQSNKLQAITPTARTLSTNPAPVGTAQP